MLSKGGCGIHNETCIMWREGETNINYCNFLVYNGYAPGMLVIYFKTHSACVVWQEGHDSCLLVSNHQSCDHTPIIRIIASYVTTPQNTVWYWFKPLLSSCISAQVTDSMLYCLYPSGVYINKGVTVQSPTVIVDFQELSPWQPADRGREGLMSVALTGCYSIETPTSSLPSNAC